MRRIILSLLFCVSMFPAFPRQPERGYRGFVEWSNSLRSIDMWGTGDRSTTFYTGVSTTHGYQINPWIFVGAGIDYERCQRIEANLFSMYVDGRTDLKFGRFTPYGDIRLGYGFTDGGGVYFSPTIGYRFNWGRKVGVNLGVGATVQGYCHDIYKVAVNPEGWQIAVKTGTSRGCVGYFTFRIGFDF